MANTDKAISGAGAAPTLSGAAGRYAEALFDLAEEADAVDAVVADLNGLKGLIGDSAHLRDVLRSPVYARAEKAAAMGAIIEKSGVNALTANFIGLVAEKNRLFFLEAMIEGFSKLAAHHRGEVEAFVTSAAPLSDDQERRLRGEIEGRVGRAVNLFLDVDPDLLGGLVVKVGSTMVDSSLRTKLNKMKSVMKEAS